MIRETLKFFKVLAGIVIMTPILGLQRVSERLKYKAHKLYVYGKLRVYREQVSQSD